MKLLSPANEIPFLLPPATNSCRTDSVANPTLCPLEQRLVEPCKTNSVPLTHAHVVPTCLSQQTLTKPSLLPPAKPTLLHLATKMQNKLVECCNKLMRDRSTFCHLQQPYSNETVVFYDKLMKNRLCCLPKLTQTNPTLLQNQLCAPLHKLMY